MFSVLTSCSHPTENDGPVAKKRKRTVIDQVSVLVKETVNQLREMDAAMQAQEDARLQKLMDHEREMQNNLLCQLEAMNERISLENHERHLELVDRILSRFPSSSQWLKLTPELETVVPSPPAQSDLRYCFFYVQQFEESPTHWQYFGPDLNLVGAHDRPWQTYWYFLLKGDMQSSTDAGDEQILCCGWFELSGWFSTWCATHCRSQQRATEQRNDYWFWQ